MADWLAAVRPDLTFPQQNGEASDIRIAHCPERVLPGHVLRELVQNDRVIGGMTPACSQAAAALYKLFVEGECVITNARTAEMCKLTENSFRDVNIAFANELSIICDKLDVNVWDLIALANRHPRVNILQPGAGVGGHCIAVDPWFIVHKTPAEAHLIRSAREVNDSKPEWVIKKVQEAVVRSKRTPNDLTIAIMGLAFKPDIDDLRESPALYIAEALTKKLGSNFLIVEPNIDGLPVSLLTHSLVEAAEAANKADIIVYLVGHKQFGAIALEHSTDKVIIDAVGLLHA
jgi:UDP-N-acetyl-D-mannosaminuronic acid dehydrogenase